MIEDYHKNLEVLSSNRISEASKMVIDEKLGLNVDDKVRNLEYERIKLNILKYELEYNNIID